ncbi:MAG: hypothetical protein FWE76_05130 [Symbiobacteriaceae bacterium]|nr:hypothetical protein [Symbiobacteriaceae bacterium]
MGFPEDLTEGYIIHVTPDGISEIIYTSEGTNIGKFWLAPNGELYFVTEQLRHLHLHGSKKEPTLHCFTPHWQEKYATPLSCFTDVHDTGCDVRDFAMDSSGNCLFALRASIHNGFSVISLSPEGAVVWQSEWFTKPLDHKDHVLRILSDGRIVVWLSVGVLVLAPDGTPVMHHYLKGKEHASRALRLQDDSTFICTEGNELYAYNTDFSLRWHATLEIDIGQAPVGYLDGNFYILHFNDCSSVIRSNDGCVEKIISPRHDREWLDELFIVLAEIDYGKNTTLLTIIDHQGRALVKIITENCVDDIIRVGDTLYVLAWSDKTTRKTRFNPDYYTYVTAYRLHEYEPGLQETVDEDIYSLDGDDETGQQRWYMPEKLGILLLRSDGNLNSLDLAEKIQRSNSVSPGNYAVGVLSEVWSSILVEDIGPVSVDNYATVISKALATHVLTISRFEEQFFSLSLWADGVLKVEISHRFDMEVGKDYVSKEKLQVLVDSLALDAAIEDLAKAFDFDDVEEIAKTISKQLHIDCFLRYEDIQGTKEQGIFTFFSKDKP